MTTRQSGTKKAGRTRTSTAGRKKRAAAGKNALSFAAKSRKRTTTRKKKKKTQQLTPQQIKVLGLGLGAIALVILVLALSIRKANHVGTSDYTVSTAEISSRGKIKVTTVEPFDKDYYSADELAESIKTSVKDYNSQNGTHISEGIFNVSEGVATVELTYDSAADYLAFNQTPIFIGTVGEALQEGYDFSSAYSAVNRKENARILTDDNIQDNVANDCIIMAEPVNLKIPGKILYASGNLKVISDSEAEAVGTVSEHNLAILILQ